MGVIHLRIDDELEQVFRRYCTFLTKDGKSNMRDIIGKAIMEYMDNHPIVEASP